MASSATNGVDVSAPKLAPRRRALLAPMSAPSRAQSQSSSLSSRYARSPTYTAVAQAHAYCAAANHPLAFDPVDFELRPTLTSACQLVAANECAGAHPTLHALHAVTPGPDVSNRHVPRAKGYGTYDGGRSV